MSKTTLIERMEKGGAAKTWIKEVEAKDRALELLAQKIAEYLAIIDVLARKREQLEAEKEELNKAFDWSAVKVAEARAENERLRKEMAAAKDSILQYLDEDHPHHTVDITVLAGADAILREALRTREDK